MFHLLGDQRLGSPFGFDPTEFEGGLALSDLMDYTSSLMLRESLFAKDQIEQRRLRFCSGRHCVRLLQKKLGLQAFEVLPGEYGPEWPEGLIGSISHSKKLAAAMILKNVRAVGLDIEKQWRVSGKVVKRIATQKEINIYSEIPAFDWTLLFSAKESVYKAISPVIRKYIGFQDVEIFINTSERSFSLIFKGGSAIGNTLDKAIGYWTELSGHLVTAVIVD